MMGASSITPDARKPAGSERVAEVISDTFTGNTAGTGGLFRGGAPGAADSLIFSSSNLGLAASVGATAWAKGMVCRLRAGGDLFKLRMIPQVVQPAVLDAWAIGLYRVDVALSWAIAHPVGVDSGLVLSLHDGNATFPAAIVGGAADGIIVYNDNGVLKFFSRGNGNTETVAIAPNAYGNLLTDWTRVALEFRQARKTAPADVRLYVNSSLVLQRRYTGAHALPVPAALASGWLGAYIIHRVSSAVQGIQHAQATVTLGPDSDGV